MKIAVVISEFPSLNETFILDQITGLIDRGHIVHIFATAPREGEFKLHPEIKRYSLLSRTVYRDSEKFTIPRNLFLRLCKGTLLVLECLLKNPRACLNSMNVFRLGRTAASLSTFYTGAPFMASSCEYDIIHCHFPSNGELAVSLRDFGVVRGKVIISLHGYNVPHFANGDMLRMYSNLAKRGDLFLFCSKHMQRWYDNQGFGAGRTIVHRYGLRTELFPGSRRRSDQTGGIRLLSVGRLVEKKGFEFAVKGVAMLLSKFPNVRYEIVGDGELRPELELLIAELGVARNVRLLGWRERDEILSLYEQTDIFLAPSVTSLDGDQEGIPLALHEAMASGLPVISTRHTGIPELVYDGKTGFLVEERDAEAIADRLTYLMEHPETWREMGERARNSVEEYNNLDEQTDRLVDIYRSLLKRRRDRRDLIKST